MILVRVTCATSKVDECFITLDSCEKVIGTAVLFCITPGSAVTGLCAVLTGNKANLSDILGNAKSNSSAVFTGLPHDSAAGVTVPIPKVTVGHILDKGVVPEEGNKVVAILLLGIACVLTGAGGLFNTTHVVAGVVAGIIAGVVVASVCNAVVSVGIIFVQILVAEVFLADKLFKLCAGYGAYTDSEKHNEYKNKRYYTLGHVFVSFLKLKN